MAALKTWSNYLFIAIVALSALVRIAVFAPFGNYSARGITHWDVIRSNVQLHNGTYSTAFAAGEEIAARWGNFGYYWNFAVWVPTFWFIPPFNFPFTIIDTVLTIYLARATHYQTALVPHSKGSCSAGITGAAYDWHKPPGTNESFFEAAARLNGTVTTPAKMCRSFVEEWQNGVALTFFYSFVSFLNIIAFFGTLTEARRRGEILKQMVLVTSASALHCMLNIPRYLLALIAGILWYLPVCVFRCLPLSFRSKVRFGRRYALKSGLGLKQKAELEVTELKTMYKQNKRSRRPRYPGGDGTPTPLAKFLSIYDILIVVTEGLHYSDIMNLSRVSKSVRQVVLPTESFEQRLEAFKRYTCLTKQRQRCWLCKKQICIECQQLPLIPLAALSHHLYNCRPFCTTCYHTKIVSHRPRPSQRLKSPYCPCAPVTGKPNILLRWYNGANFYINRQESLPKVARAVCRACNLHTAAEILQLREEKMKVELMEGRKSNGKKWTTCASWGCEKELGMGPWWWICQLDGCKECKSLVHKSWGSREGKDGIFVGEEAV